MFYPTIRWQCRDKFGGKKYNSCGNQSHVRLCTWHSLWALKWKPYLEEIPLTVMTGVRMIDFARANDEE
jgi:hypothetical protein